MVVKNIINGKCEDVLQTLDANSVHLIVTSPPYNVSIDYDGYSDNLTEEEYYKWIEKWLKGCYRVLVEGGRICVNIPNMGNKLNGKGTGLQTYVDKFIPLMKQVGFTLRDTVIWVKAYDELGETFSGGSTSWGSWCSPNNPFCRIFSELILIAHKGNPSRGRTEKNDIQPQEFMKWTRNTWFFPTENHIAEHPAPYPIELPRRLIKLHTWPGETVLDPFCGRGSTMMAAEILGRNWIGIDNSAKYCEISRKNVEKYQFQSKLSFDAEGAPEIKLEDFK